MSYDPDWFLKPKGKTMDVLTLARAKELAAEVVAEFGEDYVYPVDHKVLFPGSEEASCVYVHDGKPSCLVGQILHKHGVTLGELALRENVGAYKVADELTTTTPDVTGYLSHMQWRQDEGMSWGEAVKSANTNYR